MHKFALFYIYTMLHKIISLISVILLLSIGVMPVSAQVVMINEVCTSPPPTSSSINANSLYNTTAAEQPPQNAEWIELYNPHPCNSVDISCYTLASNMQQNTSGVIAENWGAFTFPAGTIIAPLGFVIVGGNSSQVPLLDFNLNYYRQTTFGAQYLDGESTRWFLRDEYGWIGLFDPNSAPVDAVYWDVYGNASNLYTANEYQHGIVTSTSCTGTRSFPAAVNIPGIEYVGACQPANYLSFQRITDGSMVWTSTPQPPTPRVCNGPCVVAPILNFTIQNESCAGGDGSIAMTITDGHTGPYTTNWLNPAGVHTNTLSNLSSGTYIVQVVDAYSCFIVYDTVVVSGLPLPTITLNNINDETCTSSNGSVTAAVSNGNLPITYHWNTTPASTTPTIANLPAGTYQVSITDQLGCTASNSVTLQNFPGPQIAIDSIKNEMCSASNGEVFTNITSGSTPFTFAWNSSPVQHNQTLMGVAAGNYSVTITDVHGCKSTADTSLTNTPPPIVSFINIQYDTCNKRTGAAEVLATGLNPPYAYSWDFDSTNVTNIISHLGAGTYTVSVTDSFCTTVASVMIQNIPGPQADFTLYPMVSTIEYPNFRFGDASTGTIDHWYWDFGDYSTSEVESPYHTYGSVGTFDVMLLITNDYGCRDSIIKHVIVIDYITLYIPNCFTPNGDGVNDRFRVYGQNICDYELFLYNRWGEMIYHSVSMDDQWDGTYKGAEVPEGVYNWTINYAEDYAGISKLAKSRKGALTVIR